MTQQALTASVSRAGAVATTADFLNYLFPPPRTFGIRLWDGSAVPGADHPECTIVLNSPFATRRIFQPPIERSAGEAYIRSDFDIEGDLFKVFSLLNTMSSIPLRGLPALGRDWLKLPAAQPTAKLSREEARLSGSSHSKSRDRAAVQYHYDVGNDFYALWLDKRLIYSCAYFPTGSEDLDTAQEKKLEHICRKLRLQPGERLLDIGCGWGGLVIYAAQKYGVLSTGITLSQKQYELAQQRIHEAGLDDRAQVKLVDYRDVSRGPFDKIVSVGMFEHVGRSKLPTYFANAYRLLKPGGLFLNHGISIHPHLAGNPSLMVQKLIGPGSFTSRYIFPDGELLPVSEVNFMAEKTGFEVRDVENWREHYALTLRQWVRRLETHHTDAVRLADETIFRTWRLYMAGAAYGFESGNINVNQSLLGKPDRGVVHIPPSRADLYAQ